MWSEIDKARFEDLRNREKKDELAPAEQAELLRMIQNLEEAEVSILKPTIENARKERLMLEEQNAALKALIQRKKRLARRLERILKASLAERQAIEFEMARILSGNTADMGIGR